MDGDQPYTPPTAPLAGGGAGPSGFTAGMIDSARKTRPWVTFLAILAGLGTALMFVGGLAVVAVGVASDAMPRLQAAALGCVYVLGGLIYALVTWKMWKLRNACRGFASGAGASTMEDLLDAHYRLWRTFGWMAAIVLGIYAVVIVLAIAGGIFASLQS